MRFGIGIWLILGHQATLWSILSHFSLCISTLAFFKSSDLWFVSSTLSSLLFLSFLPISSFPLLLSMVSSEKSYKKSLNPLVFKGSIE